MEYNSWEREFDRIQGFPDEVKVRLIVALSMLYEYMKVSGPSFVSAEDYTSSIAGRATKIYTYRRIKTGDNPAWFPWRRNAKVSVTDILFLAEAGLVYANYKLTGGRRICSKDDISKIVNSVPGVERSKIEKCIRLIKEKLNL